MSIFKPNISSVGSQKQKPQKGFFDFLTGKTKTRIANTFNDEGRKGDSQFPPTQTGERGIFDYFDPKKGGINTPPSSKYETVPMGLDGPIRGDKSKETYRYTPRNIQPPKPKVTHSYHATEFGIPKAATQRVYEFFQDQKVHIGSTFEIQANNLDVVVRAKIAYIHNQKGLYKVDLYMAKPPYRALGREAYLKTGNQRMFLFSGPDSQPLLILGMSRVSAIDEIHTTIRSEIERISRGNVGRGGVSEKAYYEVRSYHVSH